MHGPLLMHAALPSHAWPSPDTLFIIRIRGPPLQLMRSLSLARGCVKLYHTMTCLLVVHSCMHERVQTRGEGGYKMLRKSKAAISSLTVIHYQ